MTPVNSAQYVWEHGIAIAAATAQPGATLPSAYRLERRTISHSEASSWLQLHKGPLSALAVTN